MILSLVFEKSFFTAKTLRREKYIDLNNERN